MSSSLEDRIRLLTNQAVAAKTQPDVDAILQELNAAIRDHVHYLRAVAVEVIPEAFGTASKEKWVLRWRFCWSQCGEMSYRFRFQSYPFSRNAITLTL